MSQSIVESSSQNTCYSGELPVNSSTMSATSETSTSSPFNYTLIFNVTREFQNGSWVGFIGTPLHLFSYTLYAYYPNSTTTYIQLEPQLFINVTESSYGINIVQVTSWTNLPALEGQQQWPPFLSPPGDHSLFNGSMFMGFLFPCGNQETVFFEISMTRSTSAVIQNALYCPTSSCEAVPTTTLSMGGTTYASTISGASQCIPPVQCAVPVTLSSSSPNIVQTSTGFVQLTVAFSSSNETTIPSAINGTLIQVCANRNVSCVVNNLAFLVTFKQQSCAQQDSFETCIFLSNQIMVPSVSQTNNYASLSVSVSAAQEPKVTYEIGTP